MIHFQFKPEVVEKWWWTPQSNRIEKAKAEKLRFLPPGDQLPFPEITNKTRNYPKIVDGSSFENYILKIPTSGFYRRRNDKTGSYPKIDTRYKIYQNSLVAIFAYQLTLPDFIVFILDNMSMID